MDFGTVLWVVVLVIAPIAAVLFAGALPEDLGSGGLSVGGGAPPPPRPESPIGRIERETEIRQLVQARHYRQAARGEQPLDVEAEVERLLALEEAPQDEGERQDSALREEVCQLVIVRNERRSARGEPLLDVEGEIERQLRDIGA